MKTCNDCIHQEVCYRRIEGIQETFANNCGDYISANIIDNIKKALDDQYGFTGWVDDELQAVLNIIDRNTGDTDENTH